MPLVGVILPTHDELAAHEPGRWPKWLPPEELLELSKTWGPKDSPYNYELLDAAIGDIYESDSISPTYLLNACPRSAIIQRKMPYIALADSFFAMVRGSMVHQTLEQHARPGSLAEVKFHATVEGTEVRAIPDLITPEVGGVYGLWDWKVSDNPPMYYPYKSNRRQVELNRYITNRAEKWLHKVEGCHGANCWEPFDIPVNPRTLEFAHLTLMYLGPKGPKPMTIEKKQPFVTPKGKEIMKNQPYVATDSEVEEWLLPLLDIFKIAEEAFPEWPEGLERMSIRDTSGGKVFPFGGGPTWRCPGAPICNLPACAAKRYPDGLYWDQPKEEKKSGKA